VRPAVASSSASRAPPVSITHPACQARCRDDAGIGAEPSRAAPTAESRMAGYHELWSETHFSGGRLKDERSLLREHTSAGDQVGIGSLRHYALPDPFRAFCPLLRAKLGIVVERLLHGYDEEEVCVVLKMCSAAMVGTWGAGDPTAPGSAALSALLRATGAEEPV
jgi:hypothetical protein